MNRKKNNFFDVSTLWAVGFGLMFCVLTVPRTVAIAEDAIDTANVVVTNTVEAPKILPRSTWMTPDLQKLSDWIPDREAFPPDFRPVNRIIIHHSAGNNGYPDPISTIQGIFRYHAVSMGWQDIGYNYIIDYDGNIYEGRLGGNGVRGAHVYTRSDCLNFNHGSIGIVLLGDYSNIEPSEKMYESVAKLTGWLAYVNGLDPTQTAYRSTVWQDKKNNGTCDSSDGGFVYNYYGPVVVGHKDVGNTQCPGVTNLAKIRTEAKTYANSYVGFFYRADQNSGIYEIKNGLAEIVANSSPTENMIINIPQTQLDLFSERNFTRYPDGSLLRLSGSIYLVVSNFLRRFETDSILAKLGFDAKNVMTLPDRDKELYVAGATIKYGPDGKLLSSGGTVFYIENGKKRGITSPRLFESRGFNWKDVEATDQTVLDSYLDGDVLRYKDGVLLAVNGTVFAWENEARHGITSPQLFEKLGYKWDNIIEMSPLEEQFHQIGEVKRYPAGTLVMAKGVPTVYRVNNNERQPFTSGELFMNLGYKFEDVVETSEIEIALYKDGDLVKYPDGSLLRLASSPGVFIIENGKKKEFSSSEEFLGGGHKWSDIIVLEQDNLDNYESANTTNMTGNLPVAGLVAPVLANNYSDTQTKDETLDPSIEESIEYSIPEGQKIRVALKSFTKSVGISSVGGRFSVKDASGNQIYVGSEGDIYIANYDATSDFLIEPVLNSCVQCGIVSAIKIASIDGTDIGGANPFHSGYGGATDNIFLGNIRVKYSSASQKCWMINELDIEDYVSGVAEISEDLSAEYLDMMAVVIRTYAIFYVEAGGKHSGEPFDLKNSLDGNGGDQIYKGYGFTSRARNFSLAAQRTKGTFIAYNGRPILAAYSSDSGGTTKDARQIWTASYYADKPYLWGGISDPATTVHNSTLVSASHGVGISNVGAREMIDLGSTWEEVVKYYYPEVCIRSLLGIKKGVE